MTPARLRSAAAAVALAVLAVACAPPPVPHAAPSPAPTESSALPSPTAGTVSPRPAATAPASPRPPRVRPPVRPSKPPAGTVLADWSVRRLAAQLVVVPAWETDVAAVSGEVAAGAGGVILFGSAAPADLGADLAGLDRSAPYGVRPFVMTDEEGGAVQRMADLVGWLPSAREMAATMSAGSIERLAAHVGARMRSDGVTMDLAPVLDMDSGSGPDNTDADGTRSFSAVEPTAQLDGLAFARGLADAGIVPVVKHFPGLGGATANTDVGPASTLPWSTLRAGGLLPFAAAVRAGLPAVMVCNASVPGLTRLPASLSSNVITGVLRDQLGFTGLVLTDSLSAGAVRAAGLSVPQAAVAAVSAGADMVMFDLQTGPVPDVFGATVAALQSAVATGRLSRARLEAAVRHVLTAKGVSVAG